MEVQQSLRSGVNPLIPEFWRKLSAICMYCNPAVSLFVHYLCIILDQFVDNVYYLNNEYDDCDCYRGNLWLYHDWYSL